MILDRAGTDRLLCVGAVFCGVDKQIRRRLDFAESAMSSELLRTEGLGSESFARHDGDGSDFGMI